MVPRHVALQNRIYEDQCVANPIVGDPRWLGCAGMAINSYITSALTAFAGNVVHMMRVTDGEQVRFGGCVSTVKPPHVVA